MDINNLIIMDYEIIQELGVGGSSRVFLAKKDELYFALKKFNGSVDP